MEKKYLSIIIPNYNGKRLLEKNLPDVLKAASAANDYEVEIIVVDDCSLDVSVDYLRANFPNINVIKQKQNSGFSSTVNDGVRNAKGEIVMLLNTDVAPEVGFISPLISHFANPKCFAVGCLQQSYQGSKLISSGRGIGVFSRGLLIHRRGTINKSNTLWVSGGAGAFRKSVWNELGGLNELFNPFYWEDIDLSYRALKAGYDLVFEINSVVKHVQDDSVIRKQYTPLMISTIAYRNQILFFWINVSSKKLVLSHLFWFPYNLLLAILRWDMAYLLGFMMAFQKIPGVIAARKNLQKLWQKKDEEVVSEFQTEIQSKL